MAVVVPTTTRSPVKKNAIVAPKATGSPVRGQVLKKNVAVAPIYDYWELYEIDPGNSHAAFKLGTVAGGPQASGYIWYTSGGYLVYIRYLVSAHGSSLIFERIVVL